MELNIHGRLAVLSPSTVCVYFDVDGPPALCSRHHHHQQHLNNNIMRCGMCCSWFPISAHGAYGREYENIRLKTEFKKLIAILNTCDAVCNLSIVWWSVPAAVTTRAWPVPHEVICRIIFHGEVNLKLNDYYNSKNSTFSRHRAIGSRRRHVGLIEIARGAPRTYLFIACVRSSPKQLRLISLLERVGTR